MSDQEQKFRQVIARIWKEDDFKQKFVADPKGTLAEAGFQVPAHMNVKVHFDTPDTMNIVIPRNPAESELLDETLSAVSGGTGDTCINTTCQSHCPGAISCS